MAGRSRQDRLFRTTAKGVEPEIMVDLSSTAPDGPYQATEADFLEFGKLMAEFSQGEAAASSADAGDLEEADKALKERLTLKQLKAACEQLKTFMKTKYTYAVWGDGKALKWQKHARVAQDLRDGISVLIAAIAADAKVNSESPVVVFADDGWVMDQRSKTQKTKRAKALQAVLDEVESVAVNLIRQRLRRRGSLSALQKAVLPADEARQAYKAVLTSEIQEMEAEDEVVDSEGESESNAELLARVKALVAMQKCVLDGKLYGLLERYSSSKSIRDQVIRLQTAITELPERNARSVRDMLTKVNTTEALKAADHMDTAELRKACATWLETQMKELVAGQESSSDSESSSNDSDNESKCTRCGLDCAGLAELSQCQGHWKQLCKAIAKGYDGCKPGNDKFLKRARRYLRKCDKLECGVCGAKVGTFLGPTALCVCSKHAKPLLNRARHLAKNKKLKKGHADYAHKFSEAAAAVRQREADALKADESDSETDAEKEFSAKLGKCVCCKKLNCGTWGQDAMDSQAEAEETDSQSSVCTNCRNACEAMLGTQQPSQDLLQIAPSLEWLGVLQIARMVRTKTITIGDWTPGSSFERRMLGTPAAKKSSKKDKKRKNKKNKDDSSSSDGSSSDDSGSDSDSDTEDEDRSSKKKKSKSGRLTGKVLKLSERTIEDLEGSELRGDSMELRRREIELMSDEEDMKSERRTWTRRWKKTVKEVLNTTGADAKTRKVSSQWRSTHHVKNAKPNQRLQYNELEMSGVVIQDMLYSKKLSKEQRDTGEWALRNINHALARTDLVESKKLDIAAYRRAREKAAAPSNLYLAGQAQTGSKRQRRRKQLRLQAKCLQEEMEKFNPGGGGGGGNPNHNKKSNAQKKRERRRKNQNNNNKFKGKCNKCGKQGHKERDCRTNNKRADRPSDKEYDDEKNATCGKCGKKGHSTLKCWSKKPKN